MNAIQVEKLFTGIPGFDHIAYGGLPKGRTTLLVGTAGSAKTVFAAQFIAEGIRQMNQPGVFVTFEESPEDIRRNMSSFGWDIAQWEREGTWKFVDASRRFNDPQMVGGSYDLSALLARIHSAIHSIGAERVSLDSIGAVTSQFSDADALRDVLFRLEASLKQMNVTTILTAEQVHDGVGLTRHGVKEFLTDNVVILRNTLETERRRRTIEILKFRGTRHANGEFPLTISQEQGVFIIPLSALELNQPSSDIRVTSGNKALDEMCGGGLFRNSITLVAGATGSGKTLIASSFIAAGAASHERCLLLAYEESRSQLFRNAKGWGMNLEQMEQDGWLKVAAAYPESLSLQDHSLRIQRLIEEYRPTRVAIDSLSAFDRIATPRSLQEFLISLTSYLKQEEITGVFTTTTSLLFGNSSVSEDQTSTITDTIIVLRYLETAAQVRRGLMVLKMRGSQHDKRIREFTIDSTGIHIGTPYRSISGILSGNMSYMTAKESELVREMFDNEEQSS